MRNLGMYLRMTALMAVMMGFCFSAEAQLGGVLNKAKNKAVQQIQHNQSQTDKTQNGKSQQQNSNTQQQNSSTQTQNSSSPKAQQQQSLSPIDKAALDKMSPYETAADYNFHVATTVTKESAPEDIVRACLFFEYALSLRYGIDYDVLIGALPQAKFVIGYVSGDWPVTTGELYRMSSELSNKSPWNNSSSDRDVVSDFLSLVNMGQFQSYGTLYNMFVKTALEAGVSPLNDISGYVREQLDKMNTCKTVAAKMWFIREILHWIDTEIVGQGKIFPTAEKLYLNELKSAMDQMPADSIANLPIKFRTADELDKARIAHCEKATRSVSKPSSRDAVIEKNLKTQLKANYPSMQLVEAFCPSDATAKWDISKNSVGIPEYRLKYAEVIIIDDEHPGHKLATQYPIRQDYIGGGKYGESRFVANATTEKYLYGKFHWYFVNY
ncbi:MAG: hypothetical protein J5709_01735 [Bacteroidales bacterium]|nr:hypothetical protein [Bacteroidales bacterium]